MRLVKLSLILGAAVLFAPPALACVNVAFTGPTEVSGWNPLTGGTGVATFTATATRMSSTTRSARIIFRDGDSGTTFLGPNGSPNGPRYEIKDPGGVIVSAPVSTAPLNTGPGPHFSWGNNTTTDVSGPINFTISVLPNSSNQDFVGGTPYSEALTYSIQCFLNNNNPQNPAITGSAPTISLTVPRVISLTSASAAAINFGNFTSTSDTVNIMLKSTSTVNVSVNTLFGSSSTNQMVLSGASMPYATNATIPYSMTLNGAAVFKGSLRPNQTRGGQIGATYPLVLTLPGQPSGKIAGNYSDTITLTLTPGI